VRPHRLRLQAFGPFPTGVEVDLDALAGSGIFLLHGETGAGKTTLLDGLGFALYGRVPGVRGRTARLRADTADASVRTEVELEVTLGGRRWRIVRRPAQERPKARGTGTTTEQASVRLDEWRDGGWASVSTRIDEAAAELDPLLGMSADQFFQVVLLPQGEFAQFLRSDNDERRKLLQRLFATERFRAVEDWLADRRVRTAAALAGGQQEVRLRVARLAQAAGVEEPDPLPGGWALHLVEQARARARDAAAQAERCDTARRSARALLEDAQRLAGRQARRAEALTQRDRLARGRAAHEALGAELRAAARAAELAPLLDRTTTTAAERQAALHREATARAALVPLGLPAGADLPALRSVAESASRRTGRLDGLRGLADELAGEQQQGRVDAERAARAARAAAALVQRLAVLPARRERAAADVLAAEQARQALPAAAARSASLTAALADARALAEADQARTQLREEHLSAREEVQSLRDKESELRQNRLDTMLDELAGLLVDGVPCEVCGSTEHPDPHELAGTGASREDEERARLASEDAVRRATDLAERIAAVEATAAQLRVRLAAGGHLPDDGLATAAPGTAADGPATALPGALAALLAGADRAQAALTRAAEGLPAALAALEAVEAEQAAGGTERTRLDAEQAAAAQRAADAAGRADRLAARLAAELDGAPDLDTALQECAAVVAACDRAAQAAELALRAAEDAARAAAEATAAAATAGFGGPDEARAALKTPSWRAQTEQRRRVVDDDAAAVAVALADPELDVALDPAADVVGARRAVEGADAEHTAAVREAGAAVSRRDELEALAPPLAEALAALTPLEREHARARRLADLCAGGAGNALRMSLTSFVLAARLEEVAAAASERLLRMTQGRYALVHTDGQAKGGARSGLGLLARDAWTGSDRETSTLSGGETFLASLALALGLADVVQAEAGGTRIEALFVDEGFGTLDEQTLDEVMDVLDGLREGGRVVGLVSHVAELRARIPAQVHVHKDRQGSTLSVLGC